MLIKPRALERIATAAVIVSGLCFLVLICASVPAFAHNALLAMGVAAILVAVAGAFLHGEGRCPGCDAPIVEKGAHRHCTCCGYLSEGGSCRNCGHVRMAGPRARGYPVKFCHACGQELVQAQFFRKRGAQEKARARAHAPEV